MLYEVEIKESFNRFKCFESILNRQNPEGYKSILRNINIHYLLKDNLTDELEIEMTNTIVCDFSNELYVSLKESAFLIKKLSFILDKEMLINSLKLQYDSLDTTNGILLNQMISTGYNVVIKPKLYGTSNNIEVIGFYIPL